MPNVPAKQMVLGVVKLLNAVSSVVNPQHFIMCEGYCSHSVCVCVCVSVTKLTGLYTLQTGCH